MEKIKKNLKILLTKRLVNKPKLILQQKQLFKVLSSIKFKIKFRDFIHI